MSALAEQQRALLAALWQPRHADAIETVAAHVAVAGTAGQKHLERGLLAYRSNGLLLAERALATAYPAVQALIGAGNFEALAHLLWRGDPPRRGDLAHWGEGFAALVESLPDLAQAEPHLADVARVEWALHTAAIAPDAEPDLPSLGLLATHDPAALVLQLAPGTQCIASAHPVATIVGNQREGRADGVTRAPETALVWRQGLRACVRAALPGEAPFLTALKRQGNLADALEAAPGFDAAAWLAPAAREGLLLAARTT